jgi:hypothetical protein
MATATRYATINRGSATGWNIINAMSDVAITIVAGAITTITISNCISDFVVPEWNHGEPAGFSGLVRHIFLNYHINGNADLRIGEVSIVYKDEVHCGGATRHRH